MRNIEAWFDEYSESHMHPINKAFHWICVPTIFWTVFAFLWSIPTGPMAGVLPYGLLNFATIGMVFTILYYAALSITLALGMAIIGVINLMICHYVSVNFATPLWQIAGVIFVVAWIGQFIGHYVEGKKPSFFKDIQFLMIGPAWVLHFIYEKLNIPYKNGLLIN